MHQILGMPTISSFQGLLVRMHFNEHEEPHLHVRYAEHMAFVRISDGEMLAGDLPANKKRVLQKWMKAHQEELKENWKLALQKLPLNPIAGEE